MTSRPRAIVAFDHRRLLGRMCDAALVPSVDQHGVVAQLKAAVFDAVSSVIDADPSAGDVLGVLVDEETAAALAIETRELGMPLALAVERNEAAAFTLEYGDDWTRHVVAFAPDYVKVLFRWDVAGPGRDSALGRLDGVAAWCRAQGWDLLLELVPTRDDRDPLAPAVRRLVERGLAPAIWKVPAPHTDDDAAALVVAAQAAPGPAPGIVVLGGESDRRTVLQTTRRCLQVEGVTGWAVGRALWAEPLTDLLSGRGTRSQAISQMVGHVQEFLAILPAHVR